MLTQINGTMISSLDKDPKPTRMSWSFFSKQQNVVSVQVWYESYEHHHTITTHCFLAQ